MLTIGSEKPDLKAQDVLNPSYGGRTEIIKRERVSSSIEITLKELVDGGVPRAVRMLHNDLEREGRPHGGFHMFTISV